MRFVATPCKGKDLKPGDLFTTAPPSYWENRDELAIGEKVYIRTDAPCPEDQLEVDINKVVVIA